MNAVRLLEYGGQLVFSEVPTPTITGDEVLVKIKSTARAWRDITGNLPGVHGMSPSGQGRTSHGKIVPRVA